MAAGLPHDAIADTAERFRDRTATSCRNHLIPYEMQTNQFRPRSALEMALHGIPHTLVQLGNGLRLRKNRFSNSARQVAPLRGFLDYKHDLGHLLAPEIIHCVTCIELNAQALPSDPRVIAFVQFPRRPKRSRPYRAG